MNKKGVSSVVATVLVVLITLVIAAIIIAFVYPFVDEGLENADCHNFRDYYEFDDSFGLNCVTSGTSQYITRITLKANGINEEFLDSLEGAKISFLDENGDSTNFDLNDNIDSVPGRLKLRRVDSSKTKLNDPKIGEKISYLIESNKKYVEVKVSAVLNNGYNCEASDSIELDLECSESGGESQALFQECGNGYIEGDEKCELGDRGCGPDCEWLCGNNEIDFGEQCDYGDRINGDGCNENCRFEGSCGDGSVGLNEGCDGDSISCTTSDGYSGSESCLSDCSGYGGCESTSYCGDGEVDGEEACDGGDQSCDAGGNPGTQECLSDCSGYGGCNAIVICGDGIVNGGEICDGNLRSCSDSVGYSGSESCLSDCSGFDSCIINEFCGDGIVNGNEECEVGVNDGYWPCRASDCTFYCGNGIVEEYYEDGTTYLGEQCDDGDRISGSIVRWCLDNCISGD